MKLLVVVAIVGLVLAQEEPDCRRTEIDPETGETHLVVRDNDGTMGCISDEECIQYTSPESWCKSDGTCRGCIDWEGCCDLGNPAPPPLESCIFGWFLANQQCAATTGCGNSYCREDNTCFPCDPTDDAPFSLTGGSLGGNFPIFSKGQLHAALDAACQDTSFCPTAKMQVTDDDMFVIPGTEVYDNNETACDIPCTPDEFELIPDDFFNQVLGSTCKLDGSDGMDCPAYTGCSASYCRESGESVGGYGMCHFCEDDSADPTPPTCSGVTEDQHEACRVDTGCSSSYCKGSVCQECPSDGYTGAAP